VTETALPPPKPLGEDYLEQPGRAVAAADALLRSVGPIVLALGAGAAILAALGRNPRAFYGDILEGGLLTRTGFEASLTRTATLLLIAVGLVVVFRANIWNLGIDGQFLLAGVLVAGLSPDLRGVLPNALLLLLLFLVAIVVGALWTVVPAFLRAYYGVNEIITTLMMTFIGINLANLLIKTVFRDFTSTNVPQTSVLPLDERLPRLPETRSVHIGIVVALAVAVIVHYIMTRTSFGLRLNVLGANPRAAGHFGLSVRRLIVVSFFVSGGIIGMAGATEILGVWGYVRADWNPAFGLTVVPLVFLARLNAIAVVPFVAFLAVLSIGGDLATRRAELANDFLLVLVGLILIFMAVTEYLGRRRALGASYLTPGLAAGLRRRAHR
jgi:general nucleoside transport system permease protein